MITSYSGGTVTYSYEYDLMGNITSVNRGVSVICSYEYDSLNQLVRENNAYANKTWKFIYDASGNFIYKYEYAYTTGALPTSCLNFGFYDYSTGTWGDMLTSYNGENISYDEIGNPLSWRNEASLSWSGRELTYVYSDNGLSGMYFQYNSDGIRTHKSHYDHNTLDMYHVDYIVDGAKILAERYTHEINGTSYTLYYYYDAAGSIAGFEYNGSLYYFQKNLQGDVIRICNISGDTVVQYTYDAWGNILSVSGTLADTVGAVNPFRYRGYYYDAETGFYYLNSRYYDPEVGRFINADAILGANGGIAGYNMFAYCNNNPVNYSDPSGQCWLGDNYYLIQFAWHSLNAGDTCPVCNKKVDKVFFQHPYEWSAIAEAHPGLTGREVSELVLCGEKTGQLKAKVKTEVPVAQRKKAEQSITVYCFAAGTLVKTESGDAAIETIEAGDQVWACNPETGEVALKTVVQTFINETYELILVKIGSETIETTPEHPFYVLNCTEPRATETGLGIGWVKAKNLRAGDTLLLLDGSTITIDSVTEKHLCEPVRVYNFEVEDLHTYFVGHDGMLVHNVCYDSDQQILCAWGKEYERTGIPAGDVQAYYDLCQEYRFYCRIDGPHSTSEHWNFTHLHYGNRHAHVAIIY